MATPIAATRSRAAVALETLKIYEERDICRPRARGRAGTSSVACASSRIIRWSARCAASGCIGGIEIVKDKKTKESFDPKLAVGPYAVGRAQAHGLITRSLGDTLALCPPLIINDAQIGDLLGRYAKALDDTQAWLGQQGLSAG